MIVLYGDGGWHRAANGKDGNQGDVMSQKPKFQSVVGHATNIWANPISMWMCAELRGWTSRPAGDVLLNLVVVVVEQLLIFARNVYTLSAKIMVLPLASDIIIIIKFLRWT